jgi:hypothetical protein
MFKISRCRSIGNLSVAADRSKDQNFPLPCSISLSNGASWLKVPSSSIRRKAENMDLCSGKRASWIHQLVIATILAFPA